MIGVRLGWGEKAENCTWTTIKLGKKPKRITWKSPAWIKALFSLRSFKISLYREKADNCNWITIKIKKIYLCIEITICERAYTFNYFPLNRKIGEIYTSKYKSDLGTLLIFNILMYDRVIIDWTSDLFGYLNYICFCYCWERQE